MSVIDFLLVRFGFQQRSSTNVISQDCWSAHSSEANFNHEVHEGHEEAGKKGWNALRAKRQIYPLLNFFVAFVPFVVEPSLHSPSIRDLAIVHPIALDCLFWRNDRDYSYEIISRHRDGRNGYGG